MYVMCIIIEIDVYKIEPQLILERFVIVAELLLFVTA